MTKPIVVVTPTSSSPSKTVIKSAPTITSSTSTTSMTKTTKTTNVGSDATTTTTTTTTITKNSSNDDVYDTDNNNIQHAAVKGTIFTLLLKIGSFICTQLTVRTLDPSTLGKTNIQLELLLTTILFISREGFRLSLTTTQNNGTTKNNWTVAWLTIPVVTVVSSTTLVWHVIRSSSTSGNNKNNTDDDGSTDYRIAGILFCIASWIEGCAEPAVLYFLRRLEVPQRVSAEGIATIVKTLTTVLIVQTSLSRHWHVTVFGIAQLLYAITYTTYLYMTALSRSDWPGIPSISLFVTWRQSFDWDACYLTFIYTIQGLFKHLLTEADKIVLTTMASNYDQGVYAMGASYGGIAARILLQPLEENARLLWSRLATTTITAGNSSTSPLEESYTTLVKLVTYIGLIFSCIAVHYTNLLLNVLAGRTWGNNAEAGNVLAAFCVYTAFLSLNGMTEALVYAVGGNITPNTSSSSSSSKDTTTTTTTTTTAEMTKLGMVHTLTGVAFAASASILVSKYGTIGLVAANCVAMSIRTLYSLHFAARYFAPSKVSPSVFTTFLHLLATISPHPIVLLGFAVAWVATGWSLQTLSQYGYQLRLDVRNKDWLLLTGQHLAVGLSCVIGIGTIAIPFERPFLRSLRGMVRSRRRPSEVQSSNNRLKKD